MRRWEAMPPVPRVPHADALDPVDLHAAGCAVEHPSPEFSLEVGLHPQELEPQHLRVDRNRVIASTSSLRLVDELVGLAACSAMVRTACSRISRSRRAISADVSEAFRLAGRMLP
jgi:hypothetical protein